MAPALVSNFKSIRMGFSRFRTSHSGVTGVLIVSVGGKPTPNVFLSFSANAVSLSCYLKQHGKTDGKTESITGKVIRLLSMYSRC